MWYNDKLQMRLKIAIIIGPSYISDESSELSSTLLHVTLESSMIKFTTCFAAYREFCFAILTNLQ